MNRIKEIILVTPAYGKPIVNFRDEWDVGYSMHGRQYRPSFGALEMLRKVARQMEVDFDFVGGSITLRRRTPHAPDAANTVAEGGCSCGCPSCQYCYGAQPAAPVM